MELGDIALGFVMLTVGAASAALAALYWRVGGLTLLSFGLFAFLFGVWSLLSAPPVAALADLRPAVRDYVVSVAFYLLPVPGLLFLEQVLGAEAKMLFRRLWQGSCMLALAFTAWDLHAGAGASTFLYENVVAAALVLIVLARFARSGLPRDRERRVLVAGFTAMLFSALHDILAERVPAPWDLELVNAGLSLLVLALGYVTAQQFYRAQHELAAIEYDMETARTIQASLLPHGAPPVPRLEVAVRYEPMNAVGGDMYDFVVDGRRLGVLVADVTGHGVPAAMISAMAKAAFSSQAAAAAAPSRLIAGMNRALCGQFRGQFVTATYTHVDPVADRVRYTNAGHPPPLLWRAATQEVSELTGGGDVLMGFDPDLTYATGEASIERGDRLVLYTDGVLEAADDAGVFFGGDGLKAFVERNHELGAAEFADALLAHLRERTAARGEDRAFEDDVTLVVVDVVGLTPSGFWAILSEQGRFP